MGQLKIITQNLNRNIAEIYRIISSRHICFSRIKKRSFRNIINIENIKEVLFILIL